MDLVVVLRFQFDEGTIGSALAKACHIQILTEMPRAEPCQPLPPPSIFISLSNFANFCVSEEKKTRKCNETFVFEASSPPQMFFQGI
ncbi:hypothetical protein NPIL_300591 [Nephila pilipes]|uniref:Uncharacterized protein n=1 Tax=Nephila pilipes TaxID=299642 RepID=A0A8X6UGB1_NEPPI|nr:hypothetical protein NPIL_300591 [Nephila pilipes]